VQLNPLPKSSCSANQYIAIFGMETFCDCVGGSDTVVVYEMGYSKERRLKVVFALSEYEFLSSWQRKG
jgi:hypothetical protein